jgi:K+-transporting ATPase KdpF subunit
MTALYWVGLILTFGLLAYLLVALLLPEKFS